MDGDREHLLGVVLPDDVVVEHFSDFLGRRDAVARFHQRGLVLLADDVHAQFDALVADENRRPGDKLAHLVLALAAERAVERVLGIAAADLAHVWSPSVRRRACEPVTWLSNITRLPLKVRSMDATLLPAFAGLTFQITTNRRAYLSDNQESINDENSG